jgi:hypothetical protein
VRRHAALAQCGHEGGYIGGLVGAPGTSAGSGRRVRGWRIGAGLHTPRDRE